MEFSTFFEKKAVILYFSYLCLNLHIASYSGTIEFRFEHRTKDFFRSFGKKIHNSVTISVLNSDERTRNMLQFVWLCVIFVWLCKILKNLANYIRLFMKLT